jgi:hypothetical protein
MPDWEDRKAELNEDQSALVEQLVFERKIMRDNGQWRKGGYHYEGRADFLLREGSWYLPKRWRFSYPAGVPKLCYGNSIILGKEYNLRYVEGVALPDTIRLTFDHGWNTNSRHTLIDSTWLNSGLAYLGVEFPVRLAHKALKKGIVLLDNREDNFALYKNPWKPDKP